MTAASTTDRRADAAAAMRRLLTADAAQRHDAEPGWADRVAAFEDAGRQLGFLGAAGLLTRGLRSVLAHHLIFAFNRAGVSARAQSAAAWLAIQAAFGDDGPPGAFTARAAAATPTISRMETVTMTATPDPARLRSAMVGSLTAAGHLRTPEIITAFTETERHLFLPGTDLEAAYDNDAVPVKHGGDGEMISCISAPSIVATQLEQLGVRPGDNVFEVGAATGYNAALLARLAGPAGHVWSVDVDEDLVRGAAAHLMAAGIANATVVLGDGAAGLPGHAPFDRIQFTVGSADIPSAILDQVAPGGRLVIPMRIRGSISRSVAWERDGDGPAWGAVSHEMATFVPLRKSAADDARARIPVVGDGTVTVEAWGEQDIERDALATVIDAPGATQWTEVKFRTGDPWEWAYLWLATVLPGGISRVPGKRPGGTLAAIPHGPRREPGPAHRPGPPVHHRQARQPPGHRLAEVRRHSRWAQRSPPASRSSAPTGRPGHHWASASPTSPRRPGNPTAQVTATTWPAPPGSSTSPHSSPPTAASPGSPPTCAGGSTRSSPTPAPSPGHRRHRAHVPAGTRPPPRGRRHDRRHRPRRTLGSRGRRHPARLLPAAGHVRRTGGNRQRDREDPRTDQAGRADDGGIPLPRGTHRTGPGREPARGRHRATARRNRQARGH
jgi:methyltransferase of FxLD system